jgi:uncharacterized iron-regulated protein
MLRIALLFLITFSLNIGYSQKKPAYALYNSKGKKVSYKKLVKNAEKSDVILFGEEHNNTIAHWLQLELTQKLGEDNQLVLGAEMFERDNQDELNDYLNGTIDAEELDSVARLWINYPTDYAPLVDYAKENGLIFVATNIPRRFANLVYKKGVEALDTLSDEELSWIAPIPFPYDSLLSTYQNIIKMMGEHGTPKLVKAQAIKDATMGHSIAPYLSDSTIFIHYNGAFHSNYYEGILWYLNQYADSFTALTISTVTQANVGKLEKEHLGKADFIICVDEDVTTSF